ncbi:MAG: hypothetical protein JSW68_10460 [Burkholderiales bacterium]|nr:MAG: hypothetical protein JSW68_10460 [Burkholderiales bacterium]
MARKRRARGGGEDGEDLALAERPLEFSPTARYYAPFAERAEQDEPPDGERTPGAGASKPGAGSRPGTAAAPSARGGSGKGRAKVTGRPRATIQKSGERPPPRPAPSSRDERFPSRPRERLTLGARALVNRLAPKVPLVHTVRGFSHVLNRIALVWEEPRRFYRTMDELLIDNRGNRAGFPFEVANELARLLAHYRQFVHPPPPDERWSGIDWS